MVIILRLVKNMLCLLPSISTKEIASCGQGIVRTPNFIPSVQSAGSVKSK